MPKSFEAMCLKPLKRCAHNSIEFNSIIQFNSVQFNSIQFNLNQFNSTQFNFRSTSCVQLNLNFNVKAAQRNTLASRHYLQGRHCKRIQRKLSNKDTVYKEGNQRKQRKFRCDQSQAGPPVPSS